MNDQVTEKETEEIIKVARGCLDFEGDFVELGCYKGYTSVLLAKLLRGTEKKLWIYDSFEGLPERSSEDGFGAVGAEFKAGELKVTKAEVMLKFKKAGLPLPICKKAFFEDLGPERDLPEKIAFAFLDGDLYGSIKTSLKLVEDKMVDGGVIIVHDYNNPELPGAAKAVDEWLISNRQYQTSQKYSLMICHKSARKQPF